MVSLDENDFNLEEKVDLSDLILPSLNKTGSAIDSEIKTEEIIDNHSENGSPQKIFSKVFDNKKILKIQHVSKTLANKSQNKQKKVKNHCKKCGMNFVNKIGLEVHNSEFHKKSHKCKICSKVLSSKSNLKKHINDVHDKSEQVQCTICENFLTTKGNLKKHVKSVHEGEKHIQEEELHSVNCNMCNRPFKKESYLKAHTRVFHEGKKQARIHKCAICDYSSTHKPNLLRHINKVHEKNQDHSKSYMKPAKDFECPICSLKSYTQGESNRHIREVHEGYRPFKCLKCEGTFPRKAELGRHTRAVHEKEKTYKCEACNKAFARKDVLKGHIRAIHNDEKPFKCALCDEKFGYQSNLNLHMGRAHDYKPFECSFCDNRYTFKLHLKDHIASIHEGKDPYKCVTCQKIFAHKPDLKIHSLIHIGGTLHNCTVCSAGFSSRTSFKEHMGKVHDIKTHECSVCTEKFIFKTHLIRHVSSVHDEKSITSSTSELNDVDKETSSNKNSPNTVVSHGAFFDFEENYSQNENKNIMFSIDDAIKRDFISDVKTSNLNKTASQIFYKDDYELTTQTQFTNKGLPNNEIVTETSNINDCKHSLTINENTSIPNKNSSEMFGASKNVLLWPGQFSEKDGITNESRIIKTSDDPYICKEQISALVQIENHINEKLKETVIEDYQVSNSDRIAPIKMNAKSIENSREYLISDTTVACSKQITSCTIEDSKESLNLDQNISNSDKMTPKIVNADDINKSMNASTLENLVKNPKNYFQQRNNGNKVISTRQDKIDKQNLQNPHFSYFHLLPTIPLPITDIPNCSLCNNAIFIHESDLEAHYNSHHLTKV